MYCPDVDKEKLGSTTSGMPVVPSLMLFLRRSSLPYLRASRSLWLHVPSSGAGGEASEHRGVTSQDLRCWFDGPRLTTSLLTAAVGGQSLGTLSHGDA